jgi:hypothetical protein
MGLVDDRAGFPPASLVAAAILIGVETAAELVFVVTRRDLGPGWRLVLVLTLASKAALLWAAFRRSAGAVLGLMLFELTAVFAALVAGSMAWPVRLALAAGGVASIALLAASAHAFPTPRLPERVPRKGTGDE